MHKFINDVVKKLKSILRILYYFDPKKRHYTLSRNAGLSYIFFYYQLLKYNDNKNRASKSVLFDLDSGKPDRYLFALMLYFKLSGYEIYLNPKFSFLSTCASGEYLIYIFSFLRIQKQQKVDYEYIITDNEDTLTASKQQKTIFINYEDPLNISQGEIQMQSSFHQVIYIENKTLTNSYFTELRKKLRKSSIYFKIFLAGNYKHPFYNASANNYPPNFCSNELIKSSSHNRSE